MKYCTCTVLTIPQTIKSISLFSNIKYWWEESTTCARKKKIRHLDESFRSKLNMIMISFDLVWSIKSNFLYHWSKKSFLTVLYFQKCFIYFFLFGTKMILSLFSLSTAYLLDIVNYKNSIIWITEATLGYC